MSCNQKTEEQNWRAVGDYNLRRVQITTNNNQKVDIKSNITNMTIFEDLFGVFMSAQLTFTDAAGYIDKLPISGNEQVIIELQTPGTETAKTYTFYIYLMGGQDVVGGDQKQEATLHLCSLEMLANPLIRISKSVKGTQSELAQVVFGENFSDLGKKPMYAEETLTEIKMNIPSWTPMETLCWLASNSVSKATNSPSYVFFENVNGYYFTSIEKLKRSDAKFDYYAEVNHNDPTDLEQNVRKVLGMKKDKNTNILNAIQSGSFGSKTLYHDPITKKTTEVKYENDVEPTLAATTSVLPSVLKGLSTGSSQYTTIRPVNAELFNTGEKSTSSTTADWEGRRKAYINQMISNRVVINVTGNTLIDVGETVNLYVKDQSGDGWNQSVSGKYLVSAISHNIGIKGHYMALELITDGSNKVSGGIQSS